MGQNAEETTWNSRRYAQHLALQMMSVMEPTATKLSVQ
jgi:hypothetical protein